jgi:hypothetical protein
MLLMEKAERLLTDLGEAFKDALSVFWGTARRAIAATADARFELTCDLVAVAWLVAVNRVEHVLYEGLSHDGWGYVANILIRTTLLAWPIHRFLVRLQPIVQIVKGFFRD